MTVANQKLIDSSAGMLKNKKGRALMIPQNVMNFLDTITTPASLTHTASQADFIRNAVLQEIRDKIQRCNDKGSF
jgi:hypothetical protein